jgi:hypothetical protein
MSENTAGGTKNIALGVYAMDALTSADNCVGIGYAALGATTTGGNNTGVGWSALLANSTGDSHTAFGYNALAAVTDSTGNTGVGTNAGDAITTGDSNTTIGYNSLTTLTTGSYNTAAGQDALNALTTGSGNVAIGRNAGNSQTTGNYNVVIGHSAAGNNVPMTTGTNNVIIGPYCDPSAVGAANQIVIGEDATGIGNNNVTLGKGHTGANRIYNDFSANATWTHTSDERFKKDIATNTDAGLAFINDLRTVTYKWKAPSEYDETMNAYDASDTEPSYDKKMYGFIAQEVKAAMDTHNITDFAGWHQLDNDAQDNMQGVSFEMFVMPLVKAVQELSAKNDALLARIETLEG